MHSDIAYLAHSLRSGRGVRDFRRDLIHKAQVTNGGWWHGHGDVGREGIGYMEYIYLSHLGSAGNAVKPGKICAISLYKEGVQVLLDLRGIRNLRPIENLVSGPSKL